GCKSTQPIEKEKGVTMDNSRTSLDWDGYYVGTLPCADCPGIKTELELNADQTFILRETYLDRDVASRVTTGSFNWNGQGNAIRLNSDGERTINYLVGENTLIQLDVNGNRITGPI